LPTAGDDLHPGIQHHRNFADYVQNQHDLRTT
jgi:phospholipase/lecithinase/hemolysin